MDDLRGKGKGDPWGATKTAIIKYLWENGETRGPIIRKHIKEERNVSDDRGIYRHLNQLKQEGFLVRKGEENQGYIWNCKEEIENFQNMWEEFPGARASLGKSKWFRKKITSKFNTLIRGDKELKEAFDFYLQLCPTFPKIFLDYFNSPQSIDETLEIIRYQLVEEKTSWGDIPENFYHWWLLDTVFKSAFIIDFINNQIDESALDRLVEEDTPRKRLLQRYDHYTEFRRILEILYVMSIRFKDFKIGERYHQKAVLSKFIEQLDKKDFRDIEDVDELTETIATYRDITDEIFLPNFPDGPKNLSDYKILAVLRDIISKD